MGVGLDVTIHVCSLVLCTFALHCAAWIVGASADSGDVATFRRVLVI